MSLDFVGFAELVPGERRYLGTSIVSLDRYFVEAPDVTQDYAGRMGYFQAVRGIDDGTEFKEYIGESILIWTRRQYFKFGADSDGAGLYLYCPLNFYYARHNIVIYKEVP